jgi:hypothetical protein
VRLQSSHCKVLVAACGLALTISPAFAEKPESPGIGAAEESALTKISNRVRQARDRLAKLPEHWNHLFTRGDKNAKSTAFPRFGKQQVVGLCRDTVCHQ